MFHESDSVADLTSDFDQLNDLKESSTGAEVLPQRESLYLIAKFFRSLSGFENTAEAFAKDLYNSGLFGNVVNWKGEIRPADLSDMNLLHEQMPSNQLSLHLINSVETLVRRPQTYKAISNMCPGFVPLWHQFHGKYRPSDETEFRSYTINSEKVVSLLSQLREHNLNTRSLQDKMIYLQNRQAMNNSNEIISLLPDEANEHLPKERFGTPSMGNLPTTLGTFGRTKEMIRISQEMSTYEALATSVRDEIHQVRKTLSRSGCLLSGLNIGNIDSGISWLRARSLGITRASRSQSLPLKRGYTPSAAAMHKKMSYNYKHLWTISGHMMNPAYCSVFDRTGNFILTGADDYLVKIWDANRGQLIRTCKGHLGYISLIVISPDNSLFASACTMGTIRVWRMCDGVCLQVLKHQHMAAINWMKFDPTTCALATAGDDGQCIVWDLSKMIPCEAAEIPFFDVLYDQQEQKQAADSSYNSAEIGSSYATSSMAGLKDAGVVNAFDEILEDKRSGLFEWSRMKHNDVITRQDREGNSDRLVLAHLQDASFQLSDEETLKVNCLDISPVGDILVTGSNDGVTRVWRFGDEESKGYKFRSTKRSSSADIELLRESVPNREFQRMKSAAKYLLLRLEGHVSPITDIHINKLGDRILTASCDDGNVRIWSVSKAFTRSVHIVLHLNEEDDEVVAANNQANRGGRRGGRLMNALVSRAHSKTKVYNVCWSTDDTKIISIQSVVAPPVSNSSIFLPTQPTRLKVWDSMTGDLLRVVKLISETCSRVLVAHPLNASIALTSGEDGYVNVWDIEQECSLTKLMLLNDDGSPAHIVDASFSEDGTRISVTDSFGRLSLLSLDNPERFVNVRTEQYFSTDYSNIAHDARGFAIDVGTQLPVHLAPVGSLCRIDGVAYTEPHPIQSNPSPISREEVIASLKKIEDLRLILEDEMERVFSLFCRNKHRGRLARRYKAKNYSGSSFTASGAGGLYPTKNVNSNFGGGNRSNNLHTLSSVVSSRNSGSGNYNLIDHDDRPLSSDDSDNDSDYVRRSSTRGLTRRGVHEIASLSHSAHTMDGNASSNTNRRQRSMRRRQTLPRLRRSGRSRAEPVSYNDYVDIDAAEARAERAAARRSRRQIVDDDEDSASGSDDDEDDEVVLINSSADDSNSDNENSLEGLGEDSINARSLRSSRKAEAKAERNSQRQLPISVKAAKKRREQPTTSTVDSMLEGEHPPLPQPPKIVRRKRNPLDRWNTDHIPEHVIVDRAWLQKDRTVDHQYCPQMGDLVIYFPQGHKEILSKFVENTIPPWQDNNLFTKRWPLVECEVTGISYEFPTEREFQMCASVVAVVKLAITRMPDRVIVSQSTGQIIVDLNYPRATRNNSAHTKKEFVVKLRNSDCADFLVPVHLFQRSLKLPWHVGIYVKLNYNVLKENGSVETETSVYRLKGLKSISPEWPESPWECLHIQWLRDEASTNNSLITEQVPLSSGNNYVNSASINHVSSSSSSSSSNIEPLALLEDSRQYDYNCGPWEAIPIFDESSEYSHIWHSFKSPTLLPSLCEQIVEYIDNTVAENERTFGIFVDEVDTNDAPEYGNFVHVPLHLDLIKRRLNNHYYRQIEALEFDVIKMYENCVLFNGRSSDLTQIAKELKDTLLNFIRPSVSTAEDHQVAEVQQNKRKSDLSARQEVDGTHFVSKRSRRGANDDFQSNHEESLNLLRTGGSRRSSRSVEEEGEDGKHRQQTEEATVLRITRSHKAVEAADVDKRSSRSTRIRFIMGESEEKYSDLKDMRKQSSDSETESNQEGGSDGEHQDDAENESQNHRISTRSTIKRTASRHSNEKSLPAIASTKRRSARVNYTEKGSDDEEESDDETNAQTRSSVRLKSKSASTKRRSSRRNASDSDQESTNGQKDSDLDEQHDEHDDDRMSSNTRSKRVRLTLSSQNDSICSTNGKENDVAEFSRKRSLSVTSSQGSNLLVASSKHEGGELSRAATRSAMLKTLDYMDEIDASAGLFAEPVDVEDAPDYYEIIQKPIDRATIRYNVKTRRYSACKELFDDILRIYDNCDEYNPRGSYFRSEGNRQRKLMLKFLREEMHYVPTADSKISPQAADPDSVNQRRSRSAVSVEPPLEDSSSRRSADRRRIAATRSVVAESIISPDSSSSMPSWGLRSRQSTQAMGTEGGTALRNTSATSNSRNLPSSSVTQSSSNSNSNNENANSQVSLRETRSRSSVLLSANVNPKPASEAPANNGNMLADFTELNRNSNRRLDPGTKREMLKIISYADEIDSEKNIFGAPVRHSDAPNYFEVVQHPMDRSTIRANILSRVYSSVDQVIRDVMLIFENCDLYNDSTSKIGREAATQKKLFKAFLRELNYQ